MKSEKMKRKNCKTPASLLEFIKMCEVDLNMGAISIITMNTIIMINNINILWFPMQPYEGPVNVFAASPDIPPVPGVLKDFRLILGGERMILMLV